MKTTKKYTTDYDYRGKHEFAFNNTKRKESIIESINNLIDKECYPNETYKNFMINHIDEKTTDVILYWENGSGNIVSRKYTINS